MTMMNHRRWGLVGLPRGYVLLAYPGGDSDDQTDGFRLAYPTATWGLIRRRAWLGSRALDHVLKLPYADPGRVAISGHSRNGKQSLIAAAFDPRITAVADSSSGSPAGSPYRLTSAFTFAEDPFGGWPDFPDLSVCGCDLSNLTHPDYARPPAVGAKDPRCCWWKPTVKMQEGKENETPIDSHGLYALIAPRPVVGEHAVNDGCDPTFAVEGGYLAGREVYRFLGAADKLRIDWREGQHHGFEQLDRYFDWFDIAFGRAPPGVNMSRFPEKLLHQFDWSAWSALAGGPVSPPRHGNGSFAAAIEWSLGEAPAAGPGWSPGGAYGLLDFNYIEVMLNRGDASYPEQQALPGNVTKIAINFGEYTYGHVYWKSNGSSGGNRSAVIWLHPYSYQTGYTNAYSQGSTSVCERLAAAGHVVFAFDQLGFGRRVHQGSDFYRRFPRWSKLGRMVRDVSSAVDVLLANQTDPGSLAHPDGLPITGFQHKVWPVIAPDRIYAAGYALGGIVALYTSALDPRLAGAASIAGISPLRDQHATSTTGGNDRLSRWHAVQPRLGWFDGREAELPFDYDDLIATADRPTLVLAPEADRTVDHPRLLKLLARAKAKLSRPELLTVVTTEYTAPRPSERGGSDWPAQGINRLSNQHQAALVAWLASVSGRPEDGGTGGRAILAQPARTAAGQGHQQPLPRSPGTLSSAPVSECTSAVYCPRTCVDTPWSRATPMTGSIRMLNGNSAGERQLKASVIRMVDTVSNRFGPVRNDMSTGLHLSFQYLCCFDRIELPKIEAAMATVRWQPINVSFTRVFCAGEMAIALADPAAQGALFGVVSAIEEAMAAAGLRVRTRCRAEQAPFHASLFAADVGNTTKLTEVITLAQSTIPAGQSLNPEPIVVDSFTFNGRTFSATAAVHRASDVPLH